MKEKNSPEMIEHDAPEAVSTVASSNDADTTFTAEAGALRDPNVVARTEAATELRRKIGLYEKKLAMEDDADREAALQAEITGLKRQVVELEATL